jgi:hypothetical protein
MADFVLHSVDHNGISVHLTISDKVVNTLHSESRRALRPVSKLVDITSNIFVSARQLSKHRSVERFCE